jgi:hypothetical protein
VPPGLAAVRAREAREALLDAPRPETYAGFDALLVEDTGLIWAREFTPEWAETTESTWQIFDSDGSPLGSIRTPREVRLLDVTENRIIAKSTDDLGVQRLHIFGLLR